jgi:putative two-component system response regulator
MFLSKTFSQNDEVNDMAVKMAYIAEIKEWDNRTHLFRVRYYCQLLCTGMDIPKNETEIIAIAGQLHDIGKSCIPDGLLERTGEFKKEEWPVIEKHTLDGGNILKNSSSLVLQTAAEIAENHHERWDGSGYPKKRRGEEIPLAARIFAVADVFDALTTSRPHKVTLTDEEAHFLIQQNSGVLFDPKVAKAMKEKFSGILQIKNSQSPIQYRWK